MTGAALKKRAADLRARGGVQVRVVICDRCRAAWPTERDVSHGGSRSDGEPCAYRWPDGEVCGGTVHPVGFVPPPDAPYEVAPVQAAYSGAWCELLGVPWGTTSLALVRQRYRELAKVRHPDVGGSHAAMRDLNAAYRQALAELGQPSS